MRWCWCTCSSCRLLSTSSCSRGIVGKGAKGVAAIITAINSPQHCGYHRLDHVAAHRFQLEICAGSPCTIVLVGVSEFDPAFGGRRLDEMSWSQQC